MTFSHFINISKMQLITYLNYRITCNFEYIKAQDYSGYYWITTSKVPYYPCSLISKTLEELTIEVKSIIDRWSKQ